MRRLIPAALSILAGALPALAQDARAPLAMCGPAGQQNVFWTRADGELLEAIFQTSGPKKGTWTFSILAKAGRAASAPAGAQRLEGHAVPRREIFWVTAQGALCQTEWNEAQKRWDTWTVVQGGVAAAPAVDFETAHGGRKVLVWPGKDKGLYLTEWARDKRAWTTKKILPGGVDAVQPSAFHDYYRKGRQDVFFRGTDGALWHAHLRLFNMQWITERIPGAKVASAPLAGPGPDPGTLVATWQGPGPDFGVWQAVRSTQRQWQTTQIAKGAASPLAACPGQGRPDLFWANPDGTLTRATWNAGQRAYALGTLDTGGGMGSAPGACGGPLPGQEQVFWLDAGGGLVQTTGPGTWKLNRIGSDPTLAGWRGMGPDPSSLFALGAACRLAYSPDRLKQPFIVK